MARLLWRRLVLGAVGAVLAMAGAATGAWAQEEDAGVFPLYGDGVLAVAGAGFAPDEQVMLTVTAGGESRRFDVRADARGRFRVETGIAVPPLSSVELDARGDHGTGFVAITSGPVAPLDSDGTPPLAVGPPAELPRTGEGTAGRILIPLVVAGLAALGAGWLVRRSAPGRG